MFVLYISYVVVIALPLILTATILTAAITILGSVIGDAKFWGYHPGKIWSKVVCTTLLLPVKVEGRENINKNRSYVFVANHQGAFDIFLIYGYLHRNFKWMMKRSLRAIPFVGKACESAGHIFVDRSGPRKITQTIAQAKERLVNGVSLVVFPEGARTFTGHMGYFKRGAFQLANDLELDVVPLTIDGSFDVLPRTGKMIKRRTLRLTIHQPIPYQGKGANYVRDTMKRSYTAIESALPESRQGMVENPDQEVE